MGGGGAEPHREEAPRAGARPGAKAGLTPPIFHTAVRVHPMLDILWDSLGSFLSLYICIHCCGATRPLVLFFLGTIHL